MRAAVDPGLAQVKLAVSIAVTGDVGRRRVTLRIGDRDPGQGDIALVRDREPIRHNLTRSRDRARRRALHNLQQRGLADRDHERVGVGAGLVRVGRDRVAEVAARIQLSLSDRMRAAVDPGLAQVKLAVSIAVTGNIGRRRVTLRIGDRDPGQGDIALVRDREPIRHNLTRSRDRARRRASSQPPTAGSAWCR